MKESESRCSISSIAFLLIIPVIAHILYSWRGFNPTDDGFFLAYSRRLLEGQIPHLDFISVHPVGTPMLHLPVVAFGGNYTFWISRFFVWFQFACIALAWTRIITQFLKMRWGALETILIALIGFIFSSHNFPIMAWNTIDGLFLSSLGLLLCFKNFSRHKFIGYLFIGTSFLFKQSFLPLIFVVFILGDWRLKRLWLAIFLPGLIYLGLLFLMGAGPATLLQLCSRTELLDAGFKKYIFNWIFLLGILVGYLIASFIHGAQKRIDLSTKIQHHRKLLAGTLVYGVILYAILGLIQGTYPYTKSSFLMVGCLIGHVVYQLLGKQRKRDTIQIHLLAILMAWCTSLSVGYNSPALGSGPLVLVLITYLYDSFSFFDKDDKAKKVVVYLIIIISILTMLAFNHARSVHIYYEQPATALKYPLDKQWPGSRLIKTNINTAQYVADLKLAVDKVSGRRYAMVSEFPAYWVKTPSKNPLPVDWHQKEILLNQPLFGRITESLEAQRGEMVIVVSKVSVWTLAKGFFPLKHNDYEEVPRYVRENFTKIDETKYFDLFE